MSFLPRLGPFCLREMNPDIDKSFRASEGKHFQDLIGRQVQDTRRQQEVQGFAPAAVSSKLAYF